MGSESIMKTNGQMKGLFFKSIAFFISVGTLLVFISGIDNDDPKGLVATNQKNNASSSLDLSSFESCTRKATHPPRPKQEWRKPLWFIQANHVMPSGIDKNIINQLTQLQGGGKSFYASRKGKLRHCVGTDETATCFVSGVPTYKDSFYKKTLMLVRNPATLFPFSMNMKGILYHGLEGQTPIEDWRKSRDEWFDKSLNSTINELKSYTDFEYEVGLYIAYEDLMDVVKGPKVLKEISKVLNEAGFETVEDSHLPCVWYDAVGADNIMNYHKNSNYEYSDYKPGYTKEQQKTMLEKLEAFIKDIDAETNEPLVEIIQRYHNDIKDNLTLDASE